jgi:hypothetical protein
LEVAEWLLRRSAWNWLLEYGVRGGAGRWGRGFKIYKDFLNRKDFLKFGVFKISKSP